MIEKSGLAVTAVVPPVAMPALSDAPDSSLRSDLQPVEALSAAFFTDTGDFSSNLLPSIGLGIIIAIVSLLGIGSRKPD